MLSQMNPFFGDELFIWRVSNIFYFLSILCNWFYFEKVQMFSVQAWQMDKMNWNLILLTIFMNLVFLPTFPSKRSWKHYFQIFLVMLQHCGVIMSMYILKTLTYGLSKSANARKSVSIYFYYLGGTFQLLAILIKIWKKTESDEIKSVTFQNSKTIQIKKDKTHLALKKECKNLKTKLKKQNETNFELKNVLEMKDLKYFKNWNFHKERANLKIEFKNQIREKNKEIVKLFYLKQEFEKTFELKNQEIFNLQIYGLLCTVGIGIFSIPLISGIFKNMKKGGRYVIL